MNFKMDKFSIVVIFIGFLLISCGSSSTPEASQPDTSETSKRRNVKLIPYSGLITHPKSKPDLKKEAVNKEKFKKAFEVDEISMTYTCVFNHRMHLSSASINSVTPQKAYTLINSEFEKGASSYFRSRLCSGIDKSATLNSVDVSVSIIDQ